MSQMGAAWFGMDIIRSVFGLIDYICFTILGWTYELFFDVATAQLFSNKVITDFYSRMQLILGVYMVFKLTISVLKSIVNPDNIAAKGTGTSALIVRIITSLVMLTLLVPIKVNNPTTSYDVQINNNGILFGTLYSLQERVLNNNTIGRLVLGRTAAKDADSQADALVDMKNNFVSTIAKAFVQINMTSTNGDKAICSRGKSSAVDNYDNLSIEGLFLNGGITQSCDGKYALAYIPVVGGIVAGVFAFLLVTFCIDVAVRAIQLAVLRLLAPIPIISYIDPSQDNLKQQGAFGAWSRTLVSVYLDLFLRLAIIYFVLFLIKDILTEGLGIIRTGGSGITSALAFIIVCLGLFVFAKEAPKFIKNILGIKGSLSNIGLSAALAGIGSIRQGATWGETWDNISDSARANIAAYNQGKPMMDIDTSYNFGRDQTAKLLTGDNNMTGRRMSRGSKHLAAMGVDREERASRKAAWIQSMDDEEEAKDLYDRYVNDNFANNAYKMAAVRSFAAAHGYTVDPNDSNRLIDRSGNVTTVRKAMYDDYQIKKVAQMDAKKALDEIDEVRKIYGQKRSVEAEYEENFKNRAVLSFGQKTNENTIGGRIQGYRTQKVVKDDTSTESSGTARNNGLPDWTGTGETGAGNSLNLNGSSDPGKMGGPGNNV